VIFGGVLQADGRFFLNDAAPDTFLLRRVEPGIEGSWGPLLGFRLNAQLAGDSATVNDAYFDLKFDPRATVRIGRYKGPVGLERLQSSGATAQVETGLPSELVPNRDVGVQLQGEFVKSGASYVVGLYNGAPDGRDGSTTNPDDDFELAGRVFFQPWKHGDGPLAGLGFGIGASRGAKHGNGNAFLPRYRTPGQATFFNYLGSVDADGEHTRWSPQAYYYRKAFGLLGEYVVSRQTVLLPATGQRESLANRAWQLSAAWVLTGEDASYQGVVAPDHPFAVDGTGRGAFELVARYGELQVDDDAFPLFADPFNAASRARSWGVGLNWYLTRNFKLMTNYTRTAFEGGAADGDREDEEAFFTRAQFSF
jgi:phosphate-selective porin OprO/OprP